jgi:hypothetical protein
VVMLHFLVGMSAALRVPGFLCISRKTSQR